MVFLRQMVVEQNLVHLAQFPSGYIGRKLRNSGTQQVQLVRTIGCHAIDDIVQQRCLQSHHILLTFDEAHLHIERDILVQMARSIVLLRTISRRNLEDALVDTDTNLLVELRRLSQIDLLAKIVHLEDIGTTLCSLRDNLRGINLGKAILRQEVCKRLSDSRLHLKNRHIARVTKCDLTIIKLETQERLVVTKFQGINVHHLMGRRA